MKMMKMEMELDRISNIPDDVTETILSCLSLKEAVRTSILSMKWRYKWKMLLALVFGDECVSSDECTFTLANVVDHVLLLHPGPIHKFKLSAGQDDELLTRDVDRWIFHLSSKLVIREMILYIRTGNPYNIPSCLFSCQDIVHLELRGCLLYPPPSTLKAFKSLKTLDLELVTITQDVFENLIGCSPLLERLDLIDCGGFTNLNIDAPNLRYIYIQGVFQQLNLVNSTKLVDATFDLQVNLDQSPGSSGNLINFFHQHPHIQRLTMQRDFLQYLSIGLLPEKLPKPCQYLKFLALGITFHDSCEISTMLCLLRSSPTLQELDILVDPEDQAHVREVKSCSYEDYNCTHTQLRLVKITDLTCAKAQLDFIKFLLLSSPVLERMTVKPASDDEFPKLLKELLLFKRDSKGAEIMVLDPWP